MKKFWPFILFMLAGLAFLVFLFFRWWKALDAPRVQVMTLDQIDREIHSLEKYWKNPLLGEIDQYCPKLKEAARLEKNCQPDIFNCLLQNNRSEYRALKFESQIRLKPNYRSDLPGALNPGHTFQLTTTLADTGKQIELLFVDRCRQVRLEKGVYAAGPIKKRERDWLWSHERGEIYVDKFPVKNEEVLRYARQRKKKEFIQKLKSRPPQQNAINLTAVEQEEYCQSLGGELLEAHHFDAFSFKPSENFNLKKQRYFRIPFPLTTPPKDYPFQDGYQSEDQCRFGRAKECQNSERFKKRFAVTWSGLFQSLGGELENFRNIINPKENLKISSYHFPFKHPYHRLGLRIFWDGEGFRQNNFEGLQIDRINFPVAFRCQWRDWLGGMK